MTLKQLEYVVKVAECGTVSGAAKALFVAQPSLSAAIQELESEMHLTLFHRTNKGVIVTKEGEVFLSYAPPKGLKITLQWRYRSFLPAVADPSP